MSGPRQTQPSGKSRRQRRPPAAADRDRTEEDQRDLVRPEEDRSDDRIEIGDPVPERDRTIRAGRGGVETGEDEDLPGATRRGETGEDEDLPDDDAGIESPSERH